MEGSTRTYFEIIEIEMIFFFMSEVMSIVIFQRIFVYLFLKILCIFILREIFDCWIHILVPKKLLHALIVLSVVFGMFLLQSFSMFLRTIIEFIDWSF